MHYVCHLSDKVSLLHALMITYALGKSMEIDINELIEHRLKLYKQKILPLKLFLKQLVAV